MIDTVLHHPDATDTGPSRIGLTLRRLEIHTRSRLHLHLDSARLPGILRNVHPLGRYTTTWFDMFRVEDGMVIEHWDTATRP